MRSYRAPVINDSSSLGLTLLGEVSEVDDTEISRLRDQLIAPMVPVFEGMPRHKQATLVALFRRDFEQLATLADTHQYLVGLHDVRNDLNFLFQGVPALTAKWAEKKNREKG